MLDLFFRKYAWTANLALLFAAAWLLARTVNTLVGAAILVAGVAADVAALRARGLAATSDGAGRTARPTSVSFGLSWRAPALPLLAGLLAAAVAALAWAKAKSGSRWMA